MGLSVGSAHEESFFRDMTRFLLEPVYCIEVHILKDGATHLQSAFRYSCA